MQTQKFNKTKNLGIYTWNAQNLMKRWLVNLDIIEIYLEKGIPTLKSGYRCGIIQKFDVSLIVE